MERKTILFQGDSITDAGRNRTSTVANSGLGTGYVTMLAGKLGCQYPQVDVLNRGVTGSRVGDTYSRWLEDMRNIPFAMISILLGVNDVGFQLRLNQGSDPERFEFIYDCMLREVTQTHSQAKIVLCQPFLLKRHFDHPEYGDDIYENWSLWQENVEQRAAVVKKLAEKYDAIYVPMWDALKEAQKTMPVEDLTLDCVHLTARGSYVIAQAWLQAVEGYIKANWL